MPASKPRTDQPADDSNCRHAENGGRVNAQHPVNEMQNAGLERPRVFHVPDHLTEETTLANSRDLHQQRAGAIDRAADHGSPFRLFDRDRLAGHQRLVDAGMSTDYDAVARNALAGANPHEIADADLLDRQFDLFAITSNASGLRL